jgi:hypothetical protein
MTWIKALFVGDPQSDASKPLTVFTAGSKTLTNRN